MTTNLITVDISTSIECASILLLENNISCLPVIDEERQLQGIVTWKDILRFHVYHGH
jgi:acetoin utilization protein AcuB